MRCNDTRERLGSSEQRSFSIVAGLSPRNRRACCGLAGEALLGQKDGRSARNGQSWVDQCRRVVSHLDNVYQNSRRPVTVNRARHGNESLDFFHLARAAFAATAPTLLLRHRLESDCRRSDRLCDQIAAMYSERFAGGATIAGVAASSGAGIWPVETSTVHLAS